MLWMSLHLFYLPSHPPPKLTAFSGPLDVQAPSPFQVKIVITCRRWCIRLGKKLVGRGLELGKAKDFFLQKPIQYGKGTLGIVVRFESA